LNKQNSFVIALSWELRLPDPKLVDNKILIETVLCIIFRQNGWMKNNLHRAALQIQNPKRTVGRKGKKIQKIPPSGRRVRIESIWFG